MEVYESNEYESCLVPRHPGAYGEQLWELVPVARLGSRRRRRLVAANALDTPLGCKQLAVSNRPPSISGELYWLAARILFFTD
ncbi:unnamed protein product [Heligmosomoides polygyrus]|uniref:Ricin B-type lectin domain-containing protein n=1 Tax=Heligmosomoides polygyrus TaxID=6339 RepID=A0A183FF41_HELPZ|nr:unnamed protein product [Heligmosomoides polygyrus]